MKTEEKIEKYLGEAKEPKLGSKYNKMMIMGNGVSKFRAVAEDLSDMLTDLFDTYDGVGDYHQLLDEVEGLISAASGIEYDLKEMKFPKIFK